MKNETSLRLSMRSVIYEREEIISRSDDRRNMNKFWEGKI